MKTLLEMSLEFATRIHLGMKRQSGEPYITHPVAVMKILQPYGFRESVLCAALLHDVLEDADDYESAEKELYETFGEEIYFLVSALSKDRKIRSKATRKDVYHQQLQLAMIRDPSLIFLKAADLLHNVSTLQYLTPARQKRWIMELKDFYLYHFLENYHLVPESQKKLYHLLIDQLREVVERYQRLLNISPNFSKLQS